MFKSLFGFFNGKSSTPIFDDEIRVVFAYETLSQSELQMLQRIVAEKISNLERDVAFCKHDASVYGKGSEERDFLFKEASKKQSKINKLSALQYRLKHKIAVEG